MASTVLCALDAIDRDDLDELLRCVAVMTVRRDDSTLFVRARDGRVGVALRRTFETEQLLARRPGLRARCAIDYAPDSTETRSLAWLLTQWNVVGKADARRAVRNIAWLDGTESVLGAKVSAFCAQLHRARAVFGA